MRAGVPMIVVLVGLMASRAIGPTTTIRSDPPDRSAAAPEATANDNRAPAGNYTGDTLVLRLTATTATWHFVGDSNPPLTVAAFAEEGKAPTIPAPLIRVRTGTPIHITIHNSFDDTLIVRGLSDRSPAVDSLILLPVSYTHLRAHETGRNLVCRLLLEK